jgi:hypothetical protein
VRAGGVGFELVLPDTMVPGELGAFVP